jgi:signal transduction histidine kinase/ActR/RegA family two-component response regulator
VDRVNGRRFAGPAAFVLAYAGLSLITLQAQQFGFPEFWRVVWIPSGVAIAVVLRYGPAYVGWTFLAEFLVGLLSGDPLLFAIGASTGNALEAWVGWGIMTRLGFRTTLERGRDVVTLVVGGALVGALCGALVSVSSGVLFNPGMASTPPGRLLFFWWLTHTNGILLGAPLMLAWWHGSFARLRTHRTEALLLAVAVLGLGFLLFDPQVEGVTGRRLLYVPFPVLLWTAFRFRLVGAAVANVLVAFPVMGSTALGSGPFSVPGQGDTPSPDALFQLWIFIAVNAITALFVAAVVSEREREVEARLAAEEEKRELSERVAQAKRTESLGVLAGGIAHDFNNILVSIMGHADLAAVRLGEDHPVRANVEEILQASQRAAEICRQMLAYAGRGRVSSVAVDLDELAREMTELVSVSFPRDIEVVVETHGKGRPVWADVTQLRRVTLNLLTNAADAMPQGRGTIRVSTGPLARHLIVPSEVVAGEVPPDRELVHLTVEDDGHGMSEELRDRIFEPFFTTKTLGRGLGLAAVAGIVGAHDGLLELRTSPGKGARFRMVLPATDRTVESQELRRGSHTDRWSGRLLLVDDDESVRQVTRQMLERAGAEVEEARDGLEAVRLFSRDPDRWDAVVLDVYMPVKGGLEALAEIREISPGIAAVLVTGNVSDVTEVEDYDRAPVVLKPFKAEALVEALQRAGRVERAR